MFVENKTNVATPGKKNESLNIILKNITDSAQNMR